MELQVTQENINKAFGSVARVASSRGTLPILSNVLVKTVGNRLSIAATNLDIAITHFIGAKVSKEGSITIPAKLTHEFISNLPQEVIDLKLTDNKLSIKTGKYESTINGIAADEYPVMPVINEGKTWKIATSKLKSGLQQVIGSASNDESRPVLTGVYFYSTGGNLYVVTTDSYRLSEKLISTTKEDISMLVPANAMQELLRLLGDDDSEITITHDDQQVLFKVGDVELVARLIDGKYPDYKKLIPSKFTTKAIVKRSEFSNITKVSSLFARESAGSITLELDENNQTVSIHSIASQIGENTAIADAKVSGSGSITLNSRYVIDALAACGGESVEFSFNGKLEPCLMKDSKKNDYIHIIMPLKS